MICPNCHSENKDTAMFCTKCGTKLERFTEPVKPVKPVMQPKFCRGCGAKLPEQVKFCTQCGLPVADAAQEQKAAPPQEIPQQKAASAVVSPQEKPQQKAASAVVPPQEKPQQKAASAPAAPQERSPQQKAASAPAPMQESGMTQPEGQDFVDQHFQHPVEVKHEKTKGRGVLFGILFALAVIALLVSIFILCLLFVPGLKDRVPFVEKIPGVERILPQEETPSKEDGKEETKVSEEASESWRGESETTQTDSSAISEEEAARVVMKAKELLDKGKDALIDEKYDGEDGSTRLLKNAMNRCVELSDKTGSVKETEDLVEDAFEAYSKSVLRQVELLNGQDVRPELYRQMEMDINDALEYADSLQKAGFSVDISKLNERQSSIKADYQERYITEFNDITNLDTWSRTEAWDLMQGADEAGLVDHDKLDDPMTQRYAYALARVTVKNVETALADGSMNEKEAVDELQSKLKDSDYNLFLMKTLADHRRAAGDKSGAKAMEALIQDIEDVLYSWQGIRPSEYYGLDFFWSFNEFDEYSVDDINGMTKEVHEWVRETMQEKGY